MRHEEIEIRVEPSGDMARAPAAPAVPPPPVAGDGDASLGELFKSLSSDTSALVQQEMALARAEMREMTSALAADGAKLGVAAGLALLGGFALTVTLILVLGYLFGATFWLSSLIVGVVFLAIGWALTRSAISDLKQHGKPDQTLATLQADKAWASQQARELKHDLTTDPTRATR